jgi:hypothetical protein
VNNQPTVTIAPAAVVAATATASSKIIDAGDVSIALSPKLVDVFKKLFTEAQTACTGSKKRASCDINQKFAQRVAEEARPGGLLDFVTAVTRVMLPTVTAGDVAAIAGPALYASPLVGIAVTWTLFGKLQAYTIPSDAIAGGKGGEEDKGCPADAPKGIDAVSSSYHLK